MCKSPSSATRPRGAVPFSLQCLLLWAPLALVSGTGAALAQPYTSAVDDLPPIVRMSPVEASNVTDLKALRSQGQLEALRHAQVDWLAVDLWRMQRSSIFYIAITEPDGQMRRAVRTDDERTAWLSFDELRRQAQRDVQAGTRSPARGTLPSTSAAKPAAATPADVPGGAIPRTPKASGAATAAPAGTSGTSGTSGMTRAAAIAAPTEAAAPEQERPLDGADREELAGWLAAGKLTTLRRGDVGLYSVRMMRHRESGLLMVILQQREEPWRVVRTRSAARAQRLYDEFQQRAAELAAEEARRDELAAQAEAAARDLDEAQRQARQLATELEEERRFQAQVNQQRQRGQAALNDLQQRSGALQQQLSAERRRVADLRRQLEADPPATPVPPPSAPTTGRKGVASPAGR